VTSQNYVIITEFRGRNHAEITLMFPVKMTEYAVCLNKHVWVSLEATHFCWNKRQRYSFYAKQ